MEIPFPFIDPVILDLWGKFDLRWYGFGYVAGFFIAYWVLRNLSRAGRFPFTEVQVGNLLTWLVLGVMGGGRLGYAIFYERALLKNPLRLLAIWEGGLSFHGGLLGVAIVGVLYSRRCKAPAAATADGFALAVTPGIFLVRMANFIRGELYGRLAGPDALFTMRFPSDPEAHKLLGVEKLLGREQELAIQRAYADGTWEKVKAGVPLRHPSQLYEAAGEGIFLGLFLWAFIRIARARGWRIGNGCVFGLFLAGYGAYRFCIEWLRQPDEQLGLFLFELSMGQILCFFMIGAGAVLIRRALKNPQECERRGCILWK